MPATAQAAPATRVKPQAQPQRAVPHSLDHTHGIVEIARQVADPDAAFTFDSLRQLLADAGRRLAVLPDDAEERPELEQLSRILRLRMGRERAETEREQVRATERREPLRRALLRALAERAQTPTELAQRIQTDRSTISRLLGPAGEDGLVQQHPDPDDGRRTIVSLTTAGAHALSRHRALGAPPDVSDAPPRQQVVAALALAVREAVAMRRTENRLDDAASRLDRVVAKAQEADAPEVELIARHELITTLRQAQRRRELHSHLSALSGMADGSRPVPAELVTAALAHYSYGVGRVDSGVGGGSSEERIEKLRQAAGLYATVAERGPKAPALENWGVRQGWALVSAADNFREQTQLGLAIEYADRALELFKSHSDPYGVARSHFMRGFCLRLAGEFDEAQDALAAAERLALKHEFARFHADILMQTGEVLRCRDKLPGAFAALEEAKEQAEALGLPVTRAFALSALGAAHSHQDNLSAAAACLAEARELFAQRRHSEGLALTLVRKAVVERQMTDPAAARADVSKALATYETGRSPAGKAACLVERARISLGVGRGRVGGTSVKKTCDQIVALVRDHDNRKLIVKDPWVPGLLLGLSREADHPQLTAEAKGLATDAVERLLLKKTGDGDRSAANKIVLASLRRRVEREDPMAGEHRRYVDLRPLLAPMAA